MSVMEVSRIVVADGSAGLPGPAAFLFTSASAAIRFRILGPLEVCAANGEPVLLQAPKQQVLLVTLLLHAGRPVSAQRLQTAVWPGKPPRSAAGVLRTYVSELRRMLSLGEPGQLPRLVREPGGYRLALAPGDLDQAVFDDLSSRGRTALSRGDAATAARLLSEALALWRGRPAGGIVLDEDSGIVAAALTERRLAAEEAWTDAQLMLGSGTDLIDKLRALAAGQPLRERVRGQLMLALFRAGRQAEALEEYLALRRVMTRELGVEPSALVQELHRQIMAGEPALARASTSTPVPRELPPDATDFTGRTAELSRLDSMSSGADAASPVLAVITGTAGAGKTALAVHFGRLAAGRFPDGQLFIDLRGHAEAEPMPPGEALRRFLRALGVREPPGDTDEATALYRSLLAGRRMLILLDNAASASQVRPLLPGAVGCLVLVTSRSQLPGLVTRGGATLMTVGPLAIPEGVVLVREIVGGFRVDAEPDAAASIVTRCARLPLALRAAAERAVRRPRLTLAALAAELADEQHRLDVLSDGADRDTTLRSVFSWTYRGLAFDAARMFRLLGLHPGPDISIPAAAALAAASEADAARLLEVLAQVHLAEEAAPGRYRVHALLRAYAAECAAISETPENRAAAIRRLLASG
jgi:DNA-binding SARP family transcriptional activator